VEPLLERVARQHRARDSSDLIRVGPIKTFEVVIQAGALVAVMVLYWPRVAALSRGVIGRDPAGWRLARNLLVSFLPAAVIGLLAHDAIKRLFSVGPVVAALAVGGVAMLIVDRVVRPGESMRSLDDITVPQAALIGLAQCLSLWPGTSRAMVTIVAGLLVGLPPALAAEYSFLLAIPTLGAATALDAVSGGGQLWQEVGPISVALGFLTAAVVAVVAIRGFIRYLTRHGLALFGWYRLGLSAVVWWVVSRA
jgi:undecaprenyl-diphosphatase